MISRTHFFLILFLLLWASEGFTQDSVKWEHIDSAKIKISDSVSTQLQIPLDSVSKREYFVFGLYDSIEKKDNSCIYGRFAGSILLSDTRLKTGYAPAYEPSLAIRVIEDRDWIFYLFCSFLLFLALLNISFRKYVQDLFSVMLNTSIRQKQIREQLAQAPMPSLLLNIYFFISSGVFLFFLLKQLNIDIGYGVVGSMLICTAIPASIYLGKYLILSAIFWIFDKKEAADYYLFIVFLINKMAGIFLLPFSILLAYASLKSISVILTLVIIGLVLLVLHRLIRGYDAMKTYLNLNLFHYLLFVAAFEMIPLMLIYKLLMHVIE